MLAVFWRNELVGIEIFDLSRNAHWQIGSVEACDRADAAAPLTNRSPEPLAANADGANAAYAGDDCASQPLESPHKIDPLNV
jgi:hypothetical protein